MGGAAHICNGRIAGLPLTFKEEDALGNELLWLLVLPELLKSARPGGNGG